MEIIIICLIFYIASIFMRRKFELIRDNLEYGHRLNIGIWDWFIPVFNFFYSLFDLCWIIKFYFKKSFLSLFSKIDFNLNKYKFIIWFKG